jgi:hypothetical protein
MKVAMNTVEEKCVEEVQAGKGIEEGANCNPKKDDNKLFVLLLFLCSVFVFISMPCFKFIRSFFMFVVVVLCVLRFRQTRKQQQNNRWEGRRERTEEK